MPLYPLVEELSMNAWPALHRMLFDGWVLNFADGFTRRANSVHPLYPSTLPLADKIAECERLYSRLGRETVFSVPSVCEPPDLDSVLESRGYTQAALTSVQVAPLARSPDGVDPAITLTAVLDGVQLADMHRLVGTPLTMQPTADDVLSRIAPLHTYALLRLDGQTVAMGMGVFERGWVGLFSIVVEYEQRRLGFGRRIVSALLDWGREQGASRAHLAVMCDNTPALALYASFGFAEAYRYWYRFKRRTW